MERRAVGVDLKLAAVLAGGHPGVSVRALCAQLGIHRDTYYEAKKRFAAEGLTGLLPRSRRPVRSPGQTPAAMEDAIVLARKELADAGWENGAQSIWYRLVRQGVSPPVVSTIHRVLRRRGLVVEQPQKRPKSATRRFEFADRNGCWQMDGTKWKLADATPVVIIGAEDDHTRQALAHKAAAGETGEAVWECFLLAVSRYGLPAMMLTDNGAALNASRRGRLVEFTRNLTALGITAISAGDYHPQTCGKRERLNGTLKRWLARQPAAATLTELQAQLDVFDTVYNQRPHQSLHGATPNERAATATVAHPHHQPTRRPPRIATVTVDARGGVSASRHVIGIGRRYEGLTVTVIDQDGEVAVFLGNTLLRRVTIDPTRRWQPSGNQRGGRRQTRLLSERN